MHRKAFFLIALIISPFLVHAQQGNESLSLTLTPPLFQINIAPETNWRSTVRLVNSNDYDIKVFARVVDFRPDGESGNAAFSPFAKNSKGGPHALAHWVKIPEGEILVKRSSSYEIPVEISVPSDAEPGGHYAAILVGTDPGVDAANGPGFSVGSLITSLLLVRVPGDIVEAGSIRDFYAEHTFLSTPKTSFAIRFENTGNVHLIPQGQITITNMWGKERGKIDINDQNTFGNVLPGTTRKFTFIWEGEASIFEAGRYKALATLAYGDDGRQTVFRETAFWVIPWKPVLIILLSIIAFFLFMTYAVRRYVERILLLERNRLGVTEKAPMSSVVNEPVQSTPKRQIPGAIIRNKPQTMSVRAITAPIREELRAVDTIAKRNARSSVSLFIKRNQLAILTLIVLLLGVSAITWYFVEVFRSERSYRVEVTREGGKSVIN